MKAVSDFDCRTAIELNHIGQDAGVLFPVSSVPGTSEYTGKSFYAAPGFLIRKAIRQFAQCAQRAASVGFDAVEINASGRSFIASFLSPAVNTRRDAWGSNQLGRFRFLLETVRSCKRNLPENKALGVRFNLMELSPKGAPWDEILRLIQMLRIAGADYLVGIVDGFEERVPTYSHAIPEGVWIPAYEALAQASDLPVFFTDPCTDFDQLETLAQKHDNAVFSLSTPLLGDSSFIRKNSASPKAKFVPGLITTTAAFLLICYARGVCSISQIPANSDAFRFLKSKHLYQNASPSLERDWLGCFLQALPPAAVTRSLYLKKRRARWTVTLRAQN